MVRKLVSLAFGRVAFVLLVTSFASGQTCNSDACNYCGAIAAAGTLGCALSGQGGACEDEVLAEYQQCLAAATALPPPPPPPPSPNTPCSNIVPEARPARQPGASPQRAPLSPKGVILASLNPCIVLLDPVPDLVNQAGDGVLTDPETLATGGKQVMGVAADGAARLVLQIYGSFAGEQLTLKLQGDGAPNQNGLAQPDGILQTLLPVDGMASGSQITVTAQQTSKGPIAFAQYFPSKDFSRGGNDDTSASRQVTITAKSQASGRSNQTSSTMTRPVVVLVHGVWGSAASWLNFTPFVNDGRFVVRTANYDDPVIVNLSSSSPNDYSPAALAQVTRSSIGLDYNAPQVLNEMIRFLIDFRSQGVAAAQVDIVAHSMGGLVTRKIEYLPSFTGRASFGASIMDKLITIGTPHLGSPLAIQILQPANACTRRFLADHGSSSFLTASIDGSVTRGGIGDLMGDGTGGSLNTSLTAIQQSNNGHSVPTAMIAGIMQPANLSILNDTRTVGPQYLRHECKNDPLAMKLTMAGWPTVFGQDSDAIVPLTSQRNNGTAAGTIGGLVHSSNIVGRLSLGFLGPSEVDPLGGVNTVQTSVIQMLNQPAGKSPFVLLP